jgi:hypothetical protein
MDSFKNINNMKVEDLIFNLAHIESLQADFVMQQDIDAIQRKEGRRKLRELFHD